MIQRTVDYTPSFRFYYQCLNLLLFQIQNDMSNAVNAADTLVLSVSELGRQQVNLQRDHIKNENRVNYATEAAIKAKAQADNANTELYHLNKGMKN